MRAATAAVLVCLAAPAGAQLTGPVTTPAGPPASPWDESSRTPTPPIGEQIGDIHERIRNARHAGRLTHREARRFDRQDDEIGTLSERYGQDGISPSEQRELDFRANVLREQVNAPPPPSKPARPR